VLPTGFSSLFTPSSAPRERAIVANAAPSEGGGGGGAGGMTDSSAQVVVAVNVTTAGSPGSADATGMAAVSTTCDVQEPVYMEGM
jgi:hypothetical protein